jgi:serine/threonine protein phosphatase PrpC
MRIRVASSNRLGNRSTNQDRCLISQRADSTLLVIADGMGGHDRGEIAAQTAVDSLRKRFEKLRGHLPDPADFLRNALEHAHLDVIAAGRAEQPPVQPRTVCVACIVQESHAWWAHAGDSRLYVIRDNRLVTRTRDHTPIDELVSSGAIPESATRKHPLRNSVSRCLGGGAVPPAVSSDDIDLLPGDIVLLCSDGLWSSLPERRILELYQGGYLNEAVEQLAEDAESAGYPHADNISVVALRWLGESPKLGKAVDTPVDAGIDSLASLSCDPKDFSNDDPVKRAIDEIHRAMLEYASEIKK